MNDTSTDVKSLSDNQSTAEAARKASKYAGLQNFAIQMGINLAMKILEPSNPE